MIDKTEFLDFALKQLYDIYPERGRIDNIHDKFNKPSIDDDIRKIHNSLLAIEQRYMNKYWECLSLKDLGINDIKITAEYYEIIQEYGSLSKYKHEASKQERAEKRKSGLLFWVQVLIPTLALFATVVTINLTASNAKRVDANQIKDLELKVKALSLRINKMETELNPSSNDTITVVKNSSLEHDLKFVSPPIQDKSSYKRQR